MGKNDLLLGMNIDHVATLRRARGTWYPDPGHDVGHAIIANAVFMGLEQSVREYKHLIHESRP